MPITKQRRATGTGTAGVTRRYFDAVAVRDLDAAVACWAPGGREHVRGMIDAPAPDGVREFLGAMFAALPDGRLEVVSMTTQGERCAVQWRLTGTFAGEPFQGLAPTGRR